MVFNFLPLKKRCCKATNHKLCKIYQVSKFNLFKIFLYDKNLLCVKCGFDAIPKGGFPLAGHLL